MRRNESGQRYLGGVRDVGEERTETGWDCLPFMVWIFMIVAFLCLGFMSC